MIKVLEFIFQDFVHWLGSFLMLCVICSLPAGMIKINFRERKPKDDGK